MIKKLTIVALFITLISQSTIYAQGYNFFASTSQGYESLTDAAVVNNAMWGYDTYPVPIGFDILFFNSYIDTLFVYENHPWMLTTTDLTNTKVINPFGTTLIDRGEGTEISRSTILYKVINDPGNRICIIEWRNFGFDGDYWCHLTSIDFVNFQIWLYEIDNKIEFHYGPQRVTNFECSFWGESGPIVSLVPWMNFEEDLMSDSTLWLSGNYQSPTLEMTDYHGYLNGTIQEGTVYTFNNVLTNTSKIKLTQIKIFPSPVIDVATIVLEDDMTKNCDIEIYQANGKLEKQFNAQIINGEINLPLFDISSGLKIIKIFTTKGFYVTKFIKI